jgi:hypothetical protein
LCVQCAPALTTCAMCRQAVKGSVRVQLDHDKRDSDREREHLHNIQGSNASAASHWRNQADNLW